MEIFTGKETAEESIIIAYGLEEGLRDFYLTMIEKTSDEAARSIFSKLAEVESVHQDRLIAFYNELTGKEITRDDFIQSIVSPGLEGRMSTEEYLARFHPDLNSITDIISLAMGIEAQALDLYQRASEKATDQKGRNALQQIANEERTHLQYLADFINKRIS